ATRRLESFFPFNSISLQGKLFRIFQRRVSADSAGPCEGRRLGRWSADRTSGKENACVLSTGRRCMILTATTGRLGG
ncbi:MAG: hypothetical protein WBH50_03890, partial [Fuerstiella sp.]